MKSSTLTDHSAITLALQSKGCAQRGPGFWKFNNSLLDYLVFVEQLYNVIPAYKNKYNYLTNKGLYRDMLKMKMRGFCVQYSKRKNRERRNIEKDLSDQIDALTKALATNVPVNSKTAHPPRAIPGHLTRAKLRTVGNLT